jgi:hypothetical protein
MDRSPSRRGADPGGPPGGRGNPRRPPPRTAGWFLASRRIALERWSGSRAADRPSSRPRASTRAPRRSERDAPSAFVTAVRVDSRSGPLARNRPTAGTSRNALRNRHGQGGAVAAATTASKWRANERRARNAWYEPVTSTTLRASVVRAANREATSASDGGKRPTPPAGTRRGATSSFQGRTAVFASRGRCPDGFTRGNTRAPSTGRIASRGQAPIPSTVEQPGRRPEVHP